MRNWIIGIAVVVIAGGGIYLYSVSKPDAGEDSTMHEDSSADSMMHEATTSDAMMQEGSSTDAMMAH